MLSWLEGKLVDGLEYHFGIAVYRCIINDFSDHDKLGTSQHLRICRLSQVDYAT